MSRYIDADALIERVTGNGLKPITEQIFRKLIDDAPTIDAVSVVHGEWKHDGSVWTYRFNCTNCGYHLLGKQTNYCPNCGAKMKGADDE